MKKVIILIFLLSLGTSLCFSQQIIPSDIKEVTLFSDRAQITRKAKVKVGKGLNEIFLGVDAFRIDKDSVTAKVFGKGEVFGVQFKELYLKDEPQENIKALVLKIEELQFLARKLAENKGVLVKKETFLRSVLDFSHQQVAQDIKTVFPKVEDLKNTLLFLGDSYKEINEEKLVLEQKIKELNKEIKVKKRELSSLKGAGCKTKKVISILFDSQKSQGINIEATYLSYGALWQPLYKVDVPLDLGKVNIVMFSKAQQKTGEDWQNVKLSFSNVIPLKGVGLPSLNSWFLDTRRRSRREVSYRQKSLAKSSADSLVPGSHVDKGLGEWDEEASAGVQAGFAYAEDKELPFSFEYEFPKAVTIESKDKQALMPLFSKTLKGEFFYYAVPRTNPLTFLICRAGSDRELLPGMLNVYFGGRFIGKTRLGEKKAGEKFDLNLGVDRGIKVKREVIKDKFKETFFKKLDRQTIIREIAFKITVENIKNESAKIKIIDSIPVSKTDRIEVKDIKITPEPTKKNYQDKEGVLLWELELKPNKTEEINVKFIVTYPKSMPPRGL